MSVSAGKAKELDRKADEFFQGARAALETRRFNLSCFLFEQAVKLFLKSRLLSMYGQFPRTRSLRALLAEFSVDLKPVAPFARNNRARIAALEDAYSLARYSEKRYDRADAEDASKLTEEIMTLLRAKGRRTRGGRSRPR